MSLRATYATKTGIESIGGNRLLLETWTTTLLQNSNAAQIKTTIMRRPPQLEGEERDEEKIRARSTSRELFIASITSFIGGVFLVISFISPYWLQSWEETQSPFKNMGLWEFCFYKFRHPDYQFDHLFHGCHALYGDEYRLIREKLMPGWLMVVQLFVSLTLILAILGLLVIVSLLLRCPLEWILRFEHPISMIVWGLNAFSAALLFFSVCIFGSQCWNRDWLLYPNYNFVSWSFAAALFACLFFIISAFILAKEVKAAKERKPTNKLMLMKLKPYLYNNGHSSYASTIRGSGYL